MGVGGNIPSRIKTHHNPSSASVGTDGCRISYLVEDWPKCFHLLRGLCVPSASVVSAFELLKKEEEK